jgi:hypothetical protein
VEIQPDLSAAEIVEKTKLFAESCVSMEQGLIIIAILSHGEDGLIHGTDGSTVQEKTLLNLFSEQELAEKPKLFIFVHCRWVSSFNLMFSFCSGGYGLVELG